MLAEASDTFEAVAPAHGQGTVPGKSRDLAAFDLFWIGGVAAAGFGDMARAPATAALATLRWRWDFAT